MFSHLKVITLLLLLFLFSNLSAQKKIAEIKYKKCKLKGNWQLIQTFSDTSLHSIDKAEYDAVVRLKCFHQYQEEVHYEGYHWVIEGKWQVYRHRATLALTDRKYILGKLGDVPQDILFELTELTKKNWKGNSTAEGKPVQLYYQKIK